MARKSEEKRERVKIVDEVRRTTICKQGKVDYNDTQHHRYILWFRTTTINGSDQFNWAVSVPSGTHIPVCTL